MERESESRSQSESGSEPERKSVGHPWQAQVWDKREILAWIDEILHK